MKTPNAAIIAKIEALLAAIGEKEADIKELKERVGAEVSLIGQIADPDQRLQTAVYIYWNVPAIPKRAIIGAIDDRPGAHGRFQEAASKSYGAVKCVHCRRHFYITSRDQLRSLSSLSNDGQYQFDRTSATCPNCHDAFCEAQAKERERREKERVDRLTEIRNMPHQEYLETPEWRQRRDEHLDTAKRRSRGEPRCESCDSTRELDVIHKNPVRQGFEGYADLMIFCAACAKAVSVHGRR